MGEDGKEDGKDRCRFARRRGKVGKTVELYLQHRGSKT
jgi:hypothetical protein